MTITVEIIEYIMDHLKKHDLNTPIKNNKNITVLHYVVMVGYTDAVIYLLNNGAYHSPLDDYKCTPLHYAAAKGHIDIVKILLNVGADCTYINADGCDALEYATIFNNSDISTLLIKKKIK